MNDSRGRAPFDSKGPGRVRRAQLPLLDRLIDAEPSATTDRTLSTPAAMEALRAGVCRDLEELLNTRRRWQSWEPGLSHLKQSLVAYGLPDFASGAFNEQRRRDELRQLVEECIRTFEPRITNLKVSLVEATDKTSGTLRLRIDAMLRSDPAPEPIIFDTVVDLVAKTVTVSEEESLRVSDALLAYFNRELAALRGLAGEFAERHPKIAGRLRLTKDTVDDPHVGRLLEGVAFLGARVQHRLDDEFPELTDGLLSVLYPHYLAPLPSVAITRFSADPGLPAPARLPSGLAIDTEPVGGEPCRFRTAYPLTLWPIEVEAVRLSGMPLPAPANPAAANAAACLRITLRCSDAAMTFTQLGLDRLRFFLAGEHGSQLLELLLAHTMSVALADDQADERPVILPPDVVQAVGFAPEEALFPWPARSFSGFRLLSEYFAAREKFLFIDICRLDAKTLVAAGNRMDIFLYLDRAIPDLERAVQASSLVLGCSPIVNLFEQKCDPVPLDHTSIEYRIEPDVRRPAALEIWSVERVRESLPGGEVRTWQPFHRLTRHHMDDTPDSGKFFGTARRETTGGILGTDVYLLPHDANFDPDNEASGVLSIDALCCNRDLPASLPFGGGRPALRLVEGAAAVIGLACLTAPTPTLRLPLHERGFWRLISHLSLGHLSVVGGEAPANALREVLRLYDCRESTESRTAIRALLDVTSRPGTARVPDLRGAGRRFGGFCRGLDVTLTFDGQAWTTGGLYVLASVLDRFLALHATVNSFVRTEVRLRGQPETVARWPARAGSQVLL